MPILLTRVGLEFAELVAAQDDFLGAARANRIDLTVIEVPNAHHAFDVADVADDTDDTDESRNALAQALAFVHDRLA